jgi:hypothetical protein
MTFEEYWKVNILFRLRGVMGLSDEEINSLKTLFKDTWDLGFEAGMLSKEENPCHF